MCCLKGKRARQLWERVDWFERLRFGVSGLDIGHDFFFFGVFSG